MYVYYRILENIECKIYFLRIHNLTTQRQPLFLDPLSNFLIYYDMHNSFSFKCHFFNNYPHKLTILFSNKCEHIILFPHIKSSDKCAHCPNRIDRVGKEKMGTLKKGEDLIILVFFPSFELQPNSSPSSLPNIL